MSLRDVHEVGSFASQKAARPCYLCVPHAMLLCQVKHVCCLGVSAAGGVSLLVLAA